MMNDIMNAYYLCNNLFSLSLSLPPPLSHSTTRIVQEGRGGGGVVCKHKQMCYDVCTSVCSGVGMKEFSQVPMSSMC